MLAAPQGVTLSSNVAMVGWRWEMGITENILRVHYVLDRVQRVVVCSFLWYPGGNNLYNLLIRFISSQSHVLLDSWVVCVEYILLHCSTQFQ